MPHPGLSSDLPEASRRLQPPSQQLSFSLPFRISPLALLACRAACAPEPTRTSRASVSRQSCCVPTVRLACRLPRGGCGQQSRHSQFQLSREAVACGSGGHSGGKEEPWSNKLSCLSKAPGKKKKNSLKKKENNPAMARGWWPGHLGQHAGPAQLPGHRGDPELPVPRTGPRCFLLGSGAFPEIRDVSMRVHLGPKSDTRASPRMRNRN